VVRVDPETGEVLATVEVGETPLRAALDGELLWVSVFGEGHVVAVETTTGTVVHDSDLGGGPEGIGAGFDSVWVVRQDAHVLTRLDRTGAPQADIPVGTQPRLLTFGPDAVWVSDFGAGTLVRVDPVTGGTRVSESLCEGPQGLAVDEGVVWVACTTSDEVLAVDAQTLTVRGRVAVDGEPDGLLVHDGSLWVAAPHGPTLVEISLDADAPAVLGSTPLADDAALNDRANVDLAVAGGHIWVSALRSNRLYAA
jgi:DNA-binding beta-propeller fold protein YncE